MLRYLSILLSTFSLAYLFLNNLFESFYFVFLYSNSSPDVLSSFSFSLLYFRFPFTLHRFLSRSKNSCVLVVSFCLFCKNSFFHRLAIIEISSFFLVLTSLFLAAVIPLPNVSAFLLSSLFSRL